MPYIHDAAYHPEVTDSQLAEAVKHLTQASELFKQIVKRVEGREYDQCKEAEESLNMALIKAYTARANSIANQIIEAERLGDQRKLQFWAKQRDDAAK